MQLIHKHTQQGYNMQLDRFFPGARGARLLRDLITLYDVPAEHAAAVAEFMLTQFNAAANPRRRLTSAQRFERDTKIVELKAAGRTSTQIAEEIGITPVHVNTILYNIRHAGGITQPDGAVVPVDVPTAPQGRPAVGAQYEAQMGALFVRGLTDSEIAAELRISAVVVAKARVRMISSGVHIPDSTTIVHWRGRWDRSLLQGQFKANRLATPDSEWKAGIMGTREAAVAAMEAHIEAHAKLKSEGAALGLTAFPKRKQQTPT